MGGRGSSLGTRKHRQTASKNSVLHGGTGVMTKDEYDKERANGVKPYQIKHKLRQRYKELYDSGKQQTTEFKNLEKSMDNIDMKIPVKNPIPTERGKQLERQIGELERANATIGYNTSQSLTSSRAIANNLNRGTFGNGHQVTAAEASRHTQEAKRLAQKTVEENKRALAKLREELKKEKKKYRYEW